MANAIFITNDNKAYTTTDLAKRVLADATADTYFHPIPERSGSEEVFIFVLDEVPAGVAVNKKYSLDFWNDISGFFDANIRAHRKFLDGRTTDWEIPSVPSVQSRIRKYLITGDYIIDKNYDVYHVIGFNINK